MAVLTVITDESKAAAMTRWGCQFAHAENQPITILFAPLSPLKLEDGEEDPTLATINKVLEEAHCCFGPPQTDGAPNTPSPPPEHRQDRPSGDRQPTDPGR